MTGPDEGRVATVRIDSPLPHLDRPFDYSVPDRLAGTVAVGSRVRVRFAGRLVSAVVTALGDSSAFEGTLSEIRSASAIPSVTPAGIALAEAVAARYGGSVWDVLRLMAPPRVASIEKRDWDQTSDGPGAVYEEAAARLDAAPVGAPGERVVWEALPDVAAPSSVSATRLAATAVACAARGRSAVVVVPDARAIAVVLTELERLGLRRWTSRSGGEVAILDHDDGPSVRFGSYVAAMRGHARIVVGTRPAALQPVPDLGVIAVWDESNGALEDPHAPYPHARTVAALRAERGAGLVLGGYALSAEAVALVANGWARFDRPTRDDVRARVPAVDVLTAERRNAEGGSGWHWMPGSVWRALRAALEHGPVAVVVPRTGYVRAAACARCEAWAECRECESVLALPAAGAAPVCVDHGHVQEHWHCAQCQGAQLKQVRQGVERIAEQLARMLGDVPLTVSTGAAGVVADGVVDSGVVLATPAALPAVAGGYAHLAIVDAGVPAGSGLGGELKAVRWWLSASALVRSRHNGGAVSIVGELPDAVRRALATWSPADAALDDYAERQALGLPPHRRYLAVHAVPGDVAAAWRRAGLRESDPSVTLVPLDGGAGALLPRSMAAGAVDAIRGLQRELSQAGRELRLRVDGPLQLPQ